MWLHVPISKISVLKGVLQNRYRIRALLKVTKLDTKRDFSLVKESFSNMSAPMISRENARCVILPISSLLAMLRYDTCSVKESFLCKRDLKTLLNSAWGTARGLSLTSKIAHLTFSLEIMGADILEKLSSLTNEKSLLPIFLTLFTKKSLHQLSLIAISHQISFKNHVTIITSNQTLLNSQIL